MNEIDNTDVNNLDINIDKGVEKENIKKRKKPLVFLLFVALVTIFLVAITLYKLSQYKKTKLSSGQVGTVSTKESKNEIDLDEIKKYTTLKLKSYENVELGEISKGAVFKIDDSDENLIPGIVSFRTKSQNPDDYIYMQVLDKINVSYPNNDYVYSILMLEHGHQIAVADEETLNYNIEIFAIKGDIIIELSSYGNLIRDLNLSQEDHLRCSEMTGPNEGTDWLTYSGECLSDIYESGKYDEQLTAKTNEMVSAFEIQ